MGRNLDRGLDKRSNTPKRENSGSKSPKTDRVRKETSRRLRDNNKR